MNTVSRGSSSAEPTIRCSLRNRSQVMKSREPVWLQALIIVALVVLGGWMLSKALLLEDRREASIEREHRAMSDEQERGWDKNPDGTLADTPHNRQKMGRK